MADVRWKDKPQLAGLAGTEVLAGTSTVGGAKVGGGTVAAGGDVGVLVSQIVAAAVAASRAPNILTNGDIISGTLTPSGSTDLVRITALGATLTTANPSSDFADGDGFIQYLEDDGTTRTLSWGSKYVSSEFATLPAATTAGKRHRLGFEYHAGDDKLYCMYAEVEP